MSVAFAVLHVYSLHLWYPLLICILGNILPCWVCVCWCSYQLFPGLYSWCDCAGIANLLCIDLVQACTICTHYIGECTALCAAASMTELWHSANYCEQWFVICNSVYFLGKAVVMNFSRPYSIPRASNSMLLYCCSMLDNFLLMRAMGCNVVLFRTFSYL